MKRANAVFVGVAGLMLLSGGAAAVAVTVNQSGGGDFTTIKDAIASGATEIVITDSGKYEESFAIGNPATGGPAVTLTSTKTGDDRPVITPPFADWVGPYTDTHRTDRKATVALFASGSVLRNLVIEADTENGLYMAANDVLVDKCLFRPRRGGGSLGFPKGLILFGQQGAGGAATPGGRNCNGTVIRNSELCGTPAGATLEPNNDSLLSAGWLATGLVDGTAMVRVDHFTSNGETVDITFEQCYLHHCRDAAIFPSNRVGTGVGAINLRVTGCRFDAMGKFAIRGRSVHLFVDHSIFTRTNQGNNGDSENSAIAISKDYSNMPTATVSHCLFVNCGSANGKQAYYGGVNNHNGGTFTVDHCTFDKCLNGAGVATGGGSAATRMIVTNCIFHRMGFNSPPAVDNAGAMAGSLAGSDDLVGGLYAAWSFGLVNFGTEGGGASNIWTAVFNNFKSGESDAPYISINNCLVGDIASEDSRDWATVVAGGLSEKSNVLGSRLSCGYVGETKGIRGIESVARGTPVFANTDPWAPAPYALAAGSPGQGLGATILWAWGCAVPMDFDSDNDVDLMDFQVFQACFNGPNRPPACK